MKFDQNASGHISSNSIKSSSYSIRDIWFLVLNDTTIPVVAGRSQFKSSILFWFSKQFVLQLNHFASIVMVAKDTQPLLAIQSTAWRDSCTWLGSTYTGAPHDTPVVERYWYRWWLRILLLVLQLKFSHYSLCSNVLTKLARSCGLFSYVRCTDDFHAIQRAPRPWTRTY